MCVVLCLKIVAQTWQNITFFVAFTKSNVLILAFLIVVWSILFEKMLRLWHHIKDWTFTIANRVLCTRIQDTFNKLFPPPAEKCQPILYPFLHQPKFFLFSSLSASLWQPDAVGYWMERFSLVPTSLLILAEFVVQQLHNQKTYLNNSKNVLFVSFSPFTFLGKGACRSKLYPYGSVFLFSVCQSLRLFHNCCYDIKTVMNWYCFKFLPK